MGFKARDDYDKLKADFWIWMENNSTELYQFQILGGEPMYQPEFEECLDYFERKEHPKTNWKIFSNLKHTPSKFKEKIQRINKLIESKKLKSFEIVCSQDSWGPQAEFSRFGMDLKEWEQNFNTLMESPFVGISIHSTISPTTLPTMAEFYRKIMDWNKIRQVNFGWNTILEVAEIINESIPCEIIPSTEIDTVQLNKRNEPDTYILNFWEPEISLREGIQKIIQEMEN
jgi:organic radical activating enzyme